MKWYYWIMNQGPETGSAMDRAAARWGVDVMLSGEGRRLRLAAGLSQAEVARAIGTSQVSISRMEMRKHNPRYQTLLAYGRFMIELEATL